jgi:D-glycero-alpha-D-manno-heptose 1-phosphate guanylyltransferase
VNTPLASVTAVVLAGGFGTRIRHLAPDVPKPMVPARGRPFLEWIVRHLGRQGVREVLLSTGHLAGVVAGHFASHPIAGVRVTCVPETTPLGTAGGFLNCLPAASSTPGAWLVLNGDSLVLADLNAAAAPLAKPEIEGVVLGVRVDEAARYGRIAFDGTGRLLRFQEKVPGAGVINAGVYFFKPAAVARFPQKTPLSFEQDVFPKLITDGVQLAVSQTDAPFLDIGTPESLPQAEAFVAGLERELGLGR